MKIKHTIFVGAFCALAVSAGTSVNAATTLINTNFDSGSLSPWTVNATTLTGLYQHNTLLQPAGTTTNYATSGDYAVSLNKGGGAMSSGSLNLSGGSGSETITIELAATWINGTSTRRTFVELSLNGGTDWFWLATLQNADGAGSLTLAEGSTTVTRSGIMGGNNANTTAWGGSAFTSDMVFRFTNTSSAGADVRIFIDDTVITTSVPEPSTALLGSVGLLFLLRRRR